MYETAEERAKLFGFLGKYNEIELLNKTATGFGWFVDRSLPVQLVVGVLYLLWVSLMGILVVGALLAPFWLPTLRRLAYGLATTYAAPASAPPWAADRPDVISLVIPVGVDLVSFDLDDDVRSRGIDHAEINKGHPS